MEKKDLTFYEILEVPKTATPAIIKKAYFTKARTCHPDKVDKNDLEAAELFKNISEAYNILSDEKKKALYDKYGKSAVTKKSNDPMAVYRHMFGGGKFQDTFGEVLFIEALLNPESEQFNQEQEKKKNEQFKKLVDKLTITLEPFATGAKEAFEDMAQMNIAYKMEAPSGSTLLKIIGNIYVEESNKSNSFFGFDSFLTSISDTGTYASHAFTALSSTWKLQQAKALLDASGSNPDAQIQLFDGIWELGKIEITRLVQNISRKVLTENGVKANILKSRAQGLKKLGEMYIEAGTQYQKMNNKITEYDLPPSFEGLRKTN